MENLLLTDEEFRRIENEYIEILEKIEELENDLSVKDRFNWFCLKCGSREILISLIGLDAERFYIRYQTEKCFNITFADEFREIFNNLSNNDSSKFWLGGNIIKEFGEINKELIYNMRVRNINIIKKYKHTILE